MVHLTRLAYTFFLLISSGALKAQVPRIDTSALKANIVAMQNDSLMQELRSLLDSSSQAESFLSINLSASNSLFSVKNSAFNAQQSNSEVMAILPSVSYFHKSGFGFSATGYARNIDGTPSLYQFALSPSYDHIGKSMVYGVSYTYYSKNKDFLDVVTPYDNELYSYIQARKIWLRPSLSLGWAKGKYQDVSVVQIKRSGDYYWMIDTSNVTINDFSVSGAISHSFSFKDVIIKNDMFSIVPHLSLIGGIQGYSTFSKSKVLGEGLKEKELDRIRKRYNISTNHLSSFTLQTAAFSTNFSWYLKSFSVSLGYFLGYYFDNSLVNRTTHIFNTSIGFTF